jgi:hypothetical protein
MMVAMKPIMVCSIRKRGTSSNDLPNQEKVISDGIQAGFVISEAMARKWREMIVLVDIIDNSKQSNRSL